MKAELPVSRCEVVACCFLRVRPSAWERRAGTFKGGCLSFMALVRWGKETIAETLQRITSCQ